MNNRSMPVIWQGAADVDPNSRLDSQPLHLVRAMGLAEAYDRLPAAAVRFARRLGFKADYGSHLLLPDDQGALVGLGSCAFELSGGENPEPESLAWVLGNLSLTLPAGLWHLPPETPAAAAEALVLGWLLGSYAYDRYKRVVPRVAVLVAPACLPAERVEALVARAAAIFMARDLINCPANDCGPAELAAAMEQLAQQHGAEFRQIIGDDLLVENFPLVHCVGRASAKPPRLLELTWGDPQARRVTLVGKGVCFDSGGLDIKPSSGMLLMKKDMGGAAAMLALAAMVMAESLQICLRLIIPAVENMIDGRAMRPSDIVTSRSGKTVEIGNTDAEGRLILADALTYATEGGWEEANPARPPDLLIDAATLTGAARVALGPELPAVFSRHRALVAEVVAAGEVAADPLWPMPLWPGYRRQLNSRFADLSSVGDSSHNGAITAALFLAEFVPASGPWLHIDMIAWNLSSRPGRPLGGEAQTVLALREYLDKLVEAGVG
ncbi:MAG: leucyl aminopeptidase family protein [Alphaproteobacteria bacterium]|nr:leucyl aminopeptidase family protein [Alphaproteobacteria bacterium]